MGKQGLIELAAAKVSTQRTIIISRHAQEHKIIIGQKLLLQDDEGKDINFFMKGAFNMSIDSLVIFRDAINEALSTLEQQNIL